MNGKCPSCSTTVNVPGRGGSKISDYRCPDCQVPLVGITAGKSKGRYRCPISGSIITLGQTAVQLDQLHRLVFQPGEDNHGSRIYHRTDPTTFEQRDLDRVAGRILGAGTVISSWCDPHQFDDAPEAWRRNQLARARLHLVPTSGPIAPDELLVNHQLVYRKCAACGSRIPDEPHRRPPEPWTPRRAYLVRGQRWNTRQEPIPQGPYVAGTLACPDCDPRHRP